MSNILADRRRNSNGEVDYECPKGHRVHGENVIWRQNGSGRKHPGCKKCRRDYRASYVSRPDVQAKNRLDAQRRRLENATPVYDSNGNVIPWETYLGTEKRSVPWNLLRPRSEASAAFDEFNDSLKVTTVPCRGREAEFTEYCDPRPTRDEDTDGRYAMPSREHAKQMCAPCPLLELCKDYAHLDRPDFGIWGGQRWLGGKVV